MSVSAAAAAAGLPRATVHHWRRTSLPFAAALCNASFERMSRVREDIDNLTPAAIQALREALEDPNTPQTIRLRAALAVLKHATANYADAAGLSEKDLLPAFLTRPVAPAPQHIAQQPEHQQPDQQPPQSTATVHSPDTGPQDLAPPSPGILDEPHTQFSLATRATRNAPAEAASIQEVLPRQTAHTNPGSLTVRLGQVQLPGLLYNGGGGIPCPNPSAGRPPTGSSKPLPWLCSSESSPSSR